MTWPWKVGLALALLVAAFAGGYAAHKCPQAIEQHATTAASSNSASTAVTTTTTGPRDIEIDVGGWAPPVLPIGMAGPPPERRNGTGWVNACPAEAFAGLPPGSVVRIHEGPTVQEEHRATHASGTTATTLDLKVTPATRPDLSRAFQVGFEDLLGKREFRFAVRDNFTVPLIGLPLEVEVSHTPARGLLGGLGAGVAVRF